MRMTVSYGEGFGVLSAKPKVSRDQVLALQEIMREMPQVDGMTTTHQFAGGMYCRRMEIPAGTTIVSKVHKTEHFFVGCVGELEVAGQGDTFTLRPGDVIPSPVGTKRVVHALTDVVVMTIHKTDIVEPGETLEAELVEIDPRALYDFDNRPKAGVLTAPASIRKLEGL